MASSYYDPTADAFMRRILANPADPLPRLVFADWLDETGSTSNMAWARFLRLAAEIAAAPPDDPRLPKLGAELERVGGLVRARLTYPAQIFVAYPEAMLQVLPARCALLKVEQVQVPRSVLEFVPDHVAQDCLVLPLGHVGPRLAVAIADTNVGRFRDVLEFILNRELLLFPVPRHEARAVIERTYGWDDGEFANRPPLHGVVYTDALPDADRPLGAADGLPPIVRLVNLLLAELIDSGATAIQLEPTPDVVRVWRYHGRNAPPVPRDPLPRRLLVPVVTRLRVMAGIPARNADAVQVGAIPYRFRVQSHYLGVVIEAGPHGPGVVVSTSPPNVPAALNPAA